MVDNQVALIHIHGNGGCPNSFLATALPNFLPKSRAIVPLNRKQELKVSA